MPVTLAIIGGVTGLANVGMGIHDRRQGKKMLKGLHDPNYQIPDGTQEALALSKTIGSSYNLPGQANLEQDQDQILYNSIYDINRSATDSGSALQALVRNYGGRQRAQNEIGFRAAGSYMDRQRDVQRELGNYAEAEKDQFNINVMQPFQRKFASANGMIANGNQLIGSGSSQIVGALSSGIGQSSLDAQIAKMYQSGGSGGSTSQNQGSFIPPSDGGFADYNYSAIGDE